MAIIIEVLVEPVSVFINQCFYVVQTILLTAFWSKNSDLGIRLQTMDNEHQNQACKYLTTSIAIIDTINMRFFCIYKDRNFHTNL